MTPERLASDADDFAIEETLAPVWETVQAKAATLMAGRPMSTLERRVRPDAEQAWKAMLASRQDGASRFDMRGTLGEGGMGVIRHGTQHSLRRDVAIKSIRAGDDDVAITRVLQEALITGMMEHPNVVPVYDVDIDERGVPVILLKRVEGVDWGELIADESRIRREFEADDVLEWHLGVFLQVCNAVEHAHSLGILHLDIKPSNVMVGAHGEVYLMDWGIALSMDDEAPDGLPRAADCSDILGTPSYLAPEMMEADGASLDRRTDVFLLGATLCEIATRKPPRNAGSLMATLHLALTSDIDPGEHTPAELAAVIRNATRRPIEERHPSVADLRRAVRDFLSHRDSARVAELTDLRRDRLLDMLAGDDPIARSSDSAPRLAGAATLDDEYAACRFGYGLALERWPGNEAASSALREVVTAMVEHELDHGSPLTARSLMRDASELDPALVERVELAVSAHAGDVEALQLLAQDLDPRIGQRTRWFIGTMLGGLWTAAPILIWFIDPHVTAGDLAAATASFLLLGVALGVWARDSMGKTRFNRRFGATLMSMCLAQLLLILAATPLGLGVNALNAMILFLWACTTVLATLLIEVRNWPLIPTYWGAFFATVIWPDDALLFLGLANFTFMANTSWMWRMPVRRTDAEIEAAKSFRRPSRR